MKFINSKLWKKINQRIIRFYNRLSGSYKNLIQFIGFVLEYGILINIILYGVFGISVTVQSIFGWGILWYFIKHESKDIVDTWRGE